MMVDLINIKLIEMGMKSYERDIRGLFCSKIGIKELVEMILLWLISFFVSYWGSSLLIR